MSFVETVVVNDVEAKNASNVITFSLGPLAGSMFLPTAGCYA